MNKFYSCIVLALSLTTNATTQEADWLIIDGSRNFSYNMACLLAEKQIKAVLAIRPDDMPFAQSRLPKNDVLTLIECDYASLDEQPTLKALAKGKKYLFLDPEDSCYRTWHETVMITTINAIAAASDHGMTIFYPGRIYPCGDAPCITATTPYNPTTDQGTTLAHIEQLLRRASEHHHHCKVFMVRVSYPYGPAMYDYLLSSSFKDFPTIGRLTWLFTSEKAHQFCFASDIARLFLLLSEQPMQKDFDLMQFAGENFESVRNFAERACSVAGTTLNERIIGQWRLAIACQFDYNAERGRDLAAFFQEPPMLEESTSRLKELNFTATHFEEAAQQTLEWFIQHPETRGIFKQ